MDWKKVGARSRARGRRFEDEVAKALGWSRVPFSGRNPTFGEGDVIDGFINGAGFWLAECKMRTDKGSGTVSVNGDWIVQADEASDRSGRFSVIVVGLKVTVNKKPEGLVFLRDDSASFLFDRINHADNREAFPWIPTVWREFGLHLVTKANPKGTFCLRKLLLDSIYGQFRCARVTVTAIDGVDEWLVVRLASFAELMSGLTPRPMIPGPNTREV